MAQDTDEDRIRRKAHEIWESEGHPHGRDQAHWDQAKEIIALEDSMGDTLKPRDTGAEEPDEPALAVTSQGDMPNLTDQGKDDLTDTAREPASAASAPIGSDAVVTGKGAPKAPPEPVPVTKGKPEFKR